MMTIIIFGDFLFFLLDVAHSQKAERVYFSSVVLAEYLFVIAVVSVRFDDVFKDKFGKKDDEDGAKNIA